MKIAYFSSVLNHHQIEFCDELYQRYGEDFTFVSTMDIEEQRVKLGYKLYEREYNFKMHLSDENKMVAEKLFQDADVVILGVFLENSLKRRLKAGKITFLHKERLFKEKPSVYWWVRCLLFVMREYYPFRNKPFYMMAASAYSYQDYTSLGFFKNKTFAWGYFPPIARYDIEKLMNSKQHDCFHLIWAGRLLRWKHPEYVVRVASTLKSHNIPFHIDVIGNGEMEKELRQSIDADGLSDYVHLLGAMPPEQVREYMEQANIYLFTSNREEGFGAVATEALNSACALVASSTAGATNLLVRDKVNGRVYQNDSVDELCSIVVELCKTPADIVRLGRSGYKTITELQNASVAAKRFGDVAEAMVAKKEIPLYEDGPMARLAK